MYCIAFLILFLILLNISYQLIQLSVRLIDPLADHTSNTRVHVDTFHQLGCLQILHLNVIDYQQRFTAGVHDKTMTRKNLLALIGRVLLKLGTLGS